MSGTIHAGLQSTPEPPSNLEVGVAVCDITPGGSQWLDGFGARIDPSEGVYQRIYAKAIAFRHGCQTAVLISAEVLGFDRARTASLKTRITAETGIPENAVILAATHTHCAPRVCDMVMPGVVDPEYLQHFEAACVAAAVAARSALQPACVAFSRTEDRLGINRRFPENGGVAMRPYPAGPRDPDVDTLWFTASGTGEPLATLTMAACHPTCRGGQQIGGDYPGFLCRELERRVGGVAMFVLGCAGDVRPSFTDGNNRFRMAEIEEVDAAGRALAESIILAAGTRNEIPVSGLVTRQTITEMPLEKVPTEEDLRRVAQEDELPLRRLWAKGLLECSAIPRSVSFEMQRLSLTPGVDLLFLPGEVTSEYALWLKGLEGAQNGRTLMIAAYANGAVGYIPSQSMLPLGGYEVNGSYFYYNLPAPFTQDLEARLRQSVCEMMDITTDGTEAGSIY